ncbi:hypothetical protein D5018_08180 [Parashewanella curva]|uniref:Uncharacterized protein n=2 Tax=Parashewanella curva TaxID=2338552 RepID=A0A3L8PY15_9GAMM|nr:hypothetical protein D5018_08180 [Parashewanella curva]
MSVGSIKPSNIQKLLSRQQQRQADGKKITTNQLAVQGHIFRIEQFIKDTESRLISLFHHLDLLNNAIETSDDNFIQSIPNTMNAITDLDNLKHQLDYHCQHNTKVIKTVSKLELRELDGVVSARMDLVNAAIQIDWKKFESQS